MQRGMRDGVPAFDLMNAGDIGTDPSGLDHEMRDTISLDTRRIMDSVQRALVLREGRPAAADDEIDDATYDNDSDEQGVI